MHRIRRLNQRGGRRLSLIALVTLTFVAGVFTGGGAPFAGADNSLQNTEAYETFEETWDIIQESYVDPGSIDKEALIYGATQGMVEAVGDTGHTVFIDPTRASMMDVDLSGDYIGIGVQFDYNGTFPRVIMVLPDSPAEEAGIMPGDLLTEVDGIDAWGMSSDELGDALPVGEGEVVRLTIERGEERPFRVRLELRRIEIDPVRWWMIDDTIAHLYLYEFTTGAAEALSIAIDEATAAGAESFILDLRNNGGGLIDELEAVAALFMPTGTPIYQQEDRNGNRDTRVVEDGTEFDYPLVVLVNRGTASSAEIVAAALSEAGIGTTVGETTFGTGTGLAIHTFDDGSVLFLGVVLWLTPSGEQFWKVGYEPDVTVRLYDPINRILPEDGGSLDLGGVAAGNDTQLEAAVDMLSTAIVRR
jgi:carboxyl-terminal processing protease